MCAHTNTQTQMHHCKLACSQRHTLFCPKDNARLVFCSCWWWRVVVTVLLSVGLMHYNTVLPCCVNSLSLLIENMEASHLAVHFSITTPVLFHLWSFQRTFPLCRPVIHFDNTVAFSFVFVSVHVAFFFYLAWTTVSPSTFSFWG